MHNRKKAEEEYKKKEDQRNKKEVEDRRRFDGEQVRIIEKKKKYGRINVYCSSSNDLYSSFFCV